MFNIADFFKKKPEPMTYEEPKDNTEELKARMQQKLKNYIPEEVSYVVEELGENLSEIEFMFPRLLKEISLLWPSSRAISYIEDKLVMEKGREKRQGFPFEVVEELIFLQGVLYVLNDLEPQVRFDIWN